MKKKVAVLLYSLGAGGAERQVSILLRKLSARFDFTLVLMNETTFYDIPKEVKVVFLENSRPSENGLRKLFKLPLLAWRYRRVLQSEGIDTSLSFMTRPNYINVLAKLMGSRCRTIISERSHFSLQYGYGDLQSWVNRRLVHLYGYADLVVPNAKVNGYDLQKRFGIAAPAKTIHNFIDIKSVERAAEEAIGEKRRGFLFITVGRLDAGKNHALLIEALNRCGCDAELWIIGEGPLRDALELKIETLKLQDRVKLLGKRQNPYSYLSRADCFVFGSNHEGFPNVLLEALACGLPVISTDCRSGPREILAPESDPQRETEEVEFAGYGVLTPPKDAVRMAEAMRKMFQENKVRYNYGSTAKKRAADFDVDKTIKRWTEVLDG